MTRQHLYRVLQFLHRLTDRGLSLLLGKRFREKYIPVVATLKNRLFPEYNAPVAVYGEAVLEIPLPEPAVQNTIPAIPEWVVVEMQALAQTVDPVLYPTDMLIAYCRHYAYPIMPKAGEMYQQLLQQCAVNHYAFCFAIPWLKRGGSDLVTLKHIELAHKRAVGKVLVILTGQGESPWLSRLPKGIDILNLSELSYQVSHEEMLVILARLLVQLQIDTLHIINSPHVWEIVCKHGLALRQQTNIFASLYCDDYDQYGMPVGFARQYLGLCYRHLHKVFSDNTVFPSLLQKTYGYSPDLFSVLKSPVDIEHTVIANRKPIGRRVLWAGRLDRQKRPDLLADIAALMPDVEFYVYGDALLESSNSAIDKLEQLDNVIMKGYFEGVESLPFNDFPVFLYTSQWDGIPTIVIAAALASIPIVASSVGGVIDIINDATGFPVQEIENVSSYIKAIRYALEHSEGAEKLACAARQYVENEHALSKFETAIFNTKGYFNNHREDTQCAV